MGVEEFFDVDLDLDESGLEKLDKMADKAEKDLERIEQAQKKAGGAIGGGGVGGQALPKQTIRQQENELNQRIQKLGKTGKIDLGGAGAPIQRKTAFQELQEEQDVMRKLLNSDLGVGKGTQAMGMLSNPLKTITNLAGKGLPIIGAFIAIKELIEGVLIEQTKRGGLLDRFFRDTIESRLNALREAQLSHEIRAGFQQQILTTGSGIINPRQAWNSFDLIDRDRVQVENSYAVRTKGGFE